MFIFKKQKKKFQIDFYQPYLNKVSQINNLFTVSRIKQEKTYIDINGYRRFSDSNKLVSRWLMEKKLKRRLKKLEVVHHIDGNKLNNSYSNLMIFTNQKKHHQYHLKILQKTGSWY